jgi:AraC-like DNA-binding protein
MQFHFNVYSSILLIFFTHVLVYAGMLFYRWNKQEQLSDGLLAAFLFLSALYIVPWMTGFAGWYDNREGPYRNILFYTPFVQGLFMGPLLYFYLRSLTNADFRLQRRHFLHFLPGILYLLWCLVVVVVDQLILKRYFLMNGEEDPDFAGWYQWLQRINITCYMIASVRLYQAYLRYTRQELSFAEQASLPWLRNFIVAFGIITILPLVKELLQLIPAIDQLDYIGSWYYFMAFALVVYYIAVNGFHANAAPLRKLHFEPAADELSSDRETIEPGSSQPAPESEIPAVPDLDRWKQRLETVMASNLSHTDPELTLPQLAKQCQTNPSQLSRIINAGYGQNFNDFINEYRVNALLDKLKAGEHQSQTLLGLAYDCGFNSKATFNRAFKKKTGLSPKDWISQNLPNQTPSS